jgi:hypothetical protein
LFLINPVWIMIEATGVPPSVYLPEGIELIFIKIKTTL